MFGRDSYDARLRARRYEVLARTGGNAHRASRWDANRKRRTFGVAAAAFAMVGTSLVTGAELPAQAAPVGQGFTVTASDLSFILAQIKIAENHAESRHT